MMSSTDMDVDLWSTGGTIAIGGADSLDVVDYADHGRLLSLEEALSLYVIPRGITPHPQEFSQVRSSDMGPRDWLSLRRALLEVASMTGRPAVVGHGTASMEETAYFLHLTWPREEPVVLVGSQRPPTAVASDAQANMAQALRTAVSPDSRGMGALVVMNDQIHSGRDVTKSSNYRLEAFQSREFGPLGHVDPDGSVRYHRKPLRKHTTASAFSDLDGLNEIDLPRVDVISIYAGVDGWAIDAAVAAGAKGLVIASFPPNLNPHVVDVAIDRAVASGVVVAQASRAGEGRVIRRSAFEARGLVACDNLSPQAARILLMLSLAGGADLEQIQQFYDTH